MITSIHDRIVSLNWGNIHEQLDNLGFAKLSMILDKVQREKMMQTYEDNANFRTTINMKRYRFGEGEYKYYDYTLPAELQQLRESFYPELANAANRWLSYKGKEALYP
ncbi:2OG-Fe(II) oxygenase [Sporosarcina limicola]|uniref:Uncharacterized protein n=1 Tax=Sporosarcina limicola TaxID=34101 RepID=A0A927MLF4_9BACL|nr:2OG-Fe(II) oxygenase [Sporosarcina limicola]MBE1556880.1 hypothetical protein [Sporosarcina limicola]